MQLSDVPEDAQQEKPTLYVHNQMKFIEEFSQ